MRNTWNQHLSFLKCLSISPKSFIREFLTNHPEEEIVVEPQKNTPCRLVWCCHEVLGPRKEWWTCQRSKLLWRSTEKVYQEPLLRNPNPDLPVEQKRRLYISEPSLSSSNIYKRTALNSSCRCMWCWMNITLCKAFSSSKGYFFLGVTSLRDSSNPDITVGSPLYPPIPPRNLLCADVVCNPLHPEKNYPLTLAIFVSFTWLRTKQ